MLPPLRRPLCLMWSVALLHASNACSPGEGLAFLCGLASLFLVCKPVSLPTPSSHKARAVIMQPSVPPAQGSEHGKGREWSPGCPNKAGRQSAWVASTWRSTATRICGTFRLRKQDCRLPIHELLKSPGMGRCLPTANKLGLTDSPWPSLTPCSNFPHSG